jgi:hypothetical protein
VEHRSSRQPDQSTSEKALRSVDEDAVKVIPSFNVSFTYLRILFTADQSSVVGA